MTLGFGFGEFRSRGLCWCTVGFRPSQLYEGLQGLYSWIFQHPGRTIPHTETESLIQYQFEAEEIRPRARQHRKLPESCGLPFRGGLLIAVRTIVVFPVKLLLGLLIISVLWLIQEPRSRQT